MRQYNAFLDSTEGGELRFDCEDVDTGELVVFEIEDPERWRHLNLLEGEWYRLVEDPDGVPARAYLDITEEDHYNVPLRLEHLSTEEQQRLLSENSLDAVLNQAAPSPPTTPETPLPRRTQRLWW